MQIKIDQGCLLVASFLLLMTAILLWKFELIFLAVIVALLGFICMVLAVNEYDLDED